MTRNALFKKYVQQVIEYLERDFNRSDFNVKHHIESGLLELSKAVKENEELLEILKNNDFTKILIEKEHIKNQLANF